ncbi:MAG: DUF1684 domain-containing protein [Micrococcales bacterium]|nr:DUF1684 domain-containing protein [Micrococcales bacterium]
MPDSPRPAPAPTEQEVLDRFRARREQVVTSPRGSLALTNTQWVDSEQPIWGVPGIWAPRTDGGSGLTVTAGAADGIRVDGALVDGTAVVRGSDDENPSEVRFSDTVQCTVIPQEGGASYALRVWDAESDAIRDFGSIDAFPFNPEWIVTAAFTPNPEGTTFGFEHLKDGDATREEVIPGSITFTKNGVDYDLVAFQAGKALQLVFADATSGETTYSVGRFLFIVPKPDGSITLDFNQALLPPCAFSYAFNCPMPPKQNRFPVPIEAGEKNVLNTAGALLH